jgi:putative RecB family exonuclease
MTRYSPYSHSKLGAYETCPRLFAFRYIEKPEVPDEPDAIEAVLGTVVHESLEFLYQMRLMERVVGCDELLEDFEKRWLAAGGPRAAVSRPELTPDDYFRVGQSCLERYHQRHHPFNHGQVLGTELLISIDLGDGILVRGYIDRLDRVADGRYEIHDYKTSRNLLTRDQANENRQLPLYQIAVEREFPDAESIELVWDYLRFDTQIRVKKSAEELEELKVSIRTLVGRIESATAFPIRVSALCDWCEYRPLCPAWVHPISVAKLPERDFREDEGVQLVDRLAAVRQERLEMARGHLAELRAEEENLKAAIAEFARQRGYEQVAGSTHVAAIRDGIRLIFPTKADEDYEELIAACHEESLWDQVSTLDRHRLNALMGSDATLRARFGDLIRSDEMTIVRLTKRRFDKEE